ncbi:MAG TPA: response regulator, partial [Xanthobacteraceae bacterium]|nr:response regulator [Xanthobacteraceae bacterium]
MLVVDNLNTMTRIVDGMLRKCGSANVDQVHDGPTALQKLREKSYLFVVSDREMPGMNGLELAREIRGDPKIRNAPLVIMSASSEPQHAEAAIAAGAKFFMTKPFNLTTLKDVIRQSLQSGGSGADQIRCQS